MKRPKLIFIFFLLAIFQISYSQSGFLPAFKNGYWSVVDTNLNLLFPYKFDDLKIAADGKIIAKSGNIFTLLYNDIKINLGSDYHGIESLSGSYFKTNKNQLWGIIDSTGKEILPCIFTNIWVKTKDIAIVDHDTAAYYYGFSDNRLSHKFDSIQYLHENFYLLFTDGLVSIFDASKALVSSKYATLNEVHGHIFFCTSSENKKFVVEYKSEINETETDFFYFNKIDNRFTIYRKSNLLNIEDSLIQKQYRIDAESVYKLKSSSKSNALGDWIGEQDLFVFKLNGKSGILNEEMQTILSADYESFQMNDSMISMSKSGKKGLAFKNGKILIQARYDQYSRSGNYWIVNNGAYYGVLNQTGKEIIPPVHDKIESYSGNKFFITKGKKKGLIDENNRIIIQPVYDLLNPAYKTLIFKQNDKYGIFGENGNIIVPAKYSNISILNKNYFSFTENKKKGIIDINGRIIISPFFRQIISTENPYLFYVQSDHNCSLNAEELKEKFGVEIPGSVSDFEYERYRTGIINASGQILLDPVYDPYQLSVDFEGSTIIVKEQQGVLVINFDAKGRVIDKTLFKNYISVKKAKSAILSDSLPYVWKIQNPRNQTGLIGLFHISERKVIDYYFKNVNQCIFNPELSITEGPEQKYGIVSRRTGKIKLEDVYKSIYESDFRIASLARCIKSSGTITLIDSNANIVDKGISFIDDFQIAYVRVNKGGKLKSAPRDPRQLYQITYEIAGFNRIYKSSSTDKIFSGGKWGIMNKKGEYLVQPKYSFLQLYFKGVFIAELAGKWGVISPTDKVLIDFKYDEIRHLFDTATNYWVYNPYYKVRIKNKWGIIDSVGNEIVPAKFDDVDYIFTKGNYFFKTMVDNSANPYGVVNLVGKLVLEPNYQFIGPFVNGSARIQTSGKCWKFLDTRMDSFPDRCYTEIRDFKNGFAAVKNLDGWGFIDQLGNTIIPNQYRDVGDFNEGYAKVKIKLPSRFMDLIKARNVYALIDKKGKVIYNPKASWMGDVNKGQLIVSENKKYTVRNIDGKKILPDSYVKIDEFPDFQLYVVQKNTNESALFNYKGKRLVPFGEFSDYSGFSEGLCYVSGNNPGFIDTTGIKKFDFECDETQNFHEGLAAVKIDRKWGFIDTSGKWLIQPQYAEVQNFENGFASVKTSNYERYNIDKKGNRQYPDLLAINKEYKIISENKFQGIKSIEGKVMVLPVSEEIGFYSEGFAVIKIPKLYGLIGAKGEIIASPEYPIISVAVNGMIMLMNTDEMRYIK